MTVLALFGPTGVGKTEVAIEVAEILRAQGRRPVAVSADALQVYEGLEILTGAASPDEQRRLEHRMVSVIPVTETFSVAEYARRAHAEIDAIIDDGGVPDRRRRDRAVPARRARAARPQAAARARASGRR